jgi:WD40 repeat protein
MGQELLQLHGHDGGVSCVCFSRDGRRLASGSSDKTVRLWDVENRQELPRLLEDNCVRTTRICFSPDGRLATASWDGNVHVWDATSGLELVCLRGDKDPVTGMFFSPDGRLLLTNNHSGAQPDYGALRVFDIAHGVEIFNRVVKSETLHFITFSPDGRIIALTNYRDKVTLLDAITGKELRCIHGHDVQVMCFSGDGRIGTVSGDGTARVWDAASGRSLFCLRGHKGEATCVSFSRDGRHLATGSSYGTVHVWNSPRGRLAAALLRRRIACLRGHEGAVTSVCFSGDSRRLASASTDGTICVWDAATGQKLLRLRGHDAPVRGVCFTGDDRRLVSSSGNRVRVWNLETGDFHEMHGLAVGSYLPLIASGQADFPWRAVANTLETAFEDTRTGQPIAWLPIPLEGISIHPSGRIWADVSLGYLCLFTLEGIGDPTRTTDAALLSSKNFGETSLAETREWMQAKGLQLGMALEGGDRAPQDHPIEPTQDVPLEIQTLLSKPIGDLNLSVRALKCISELNIETVGDLLKHTGDELFEYKYSGLYLGVTQLNRIRDTLRQLNLKLKND